jgi:hypothetical protein
MTGLALLAAVAVALHLRPRAPDVPLEVVARVGCPLGPMEVARLVRLDEAPKGCARTRAPPVVSRSPASTGPIPADAAHRWAQ